MENYQLSSSWHRPCGRFKQKPTISGVEAQATPLTPGENFQTLSQMRELTEGNHDTFEPAVNALIERIYTGLRNSREAVSQLFIQEQTQLGGALRLKGVRLVKLNLHDQATWKHRLSPWGAARFNEQNYKHLILLCDYRAWGRLLKEGTQPENPWLLTRDVFVQAIAWAPTEPCYQGDRRPSKPENTRST